MEELLLEKVNELYLKDIKNALEIVKEKNNLEQYEHLIRTTNLIIEKKMEKNAILATLMHSMINNNKITINEIENLFGKEVATIVNECGQIQNILTSNYKKIPSEILTSLILSIATDIQTIIIKLAGTVDSLRNFNPQTQNKEQKIYFAKNIYSPIAAKLGISDLNWQLSDYCFKLENPGAYEKIKKLVNKKRKQREELIEEVANEIKKIIKPKINAQVFGRPKNFLSIYEKMKKIPFKQMHDIYGIRIICNKEKECYEILGDIHSKYSFLPEAFDDYISKEGKGIGKKGYQSIHTAIKRGNDVIEIQIRTWEQHLKTESSIYWEYKRLRKNKDFDKTLSWERQLVEWQKNIDIENKSKRLNNQKIYIFTPKNEVIALPTGATVIDFAFAIHSDIGTRMKKATINGELVPIETKLKNLDRVEIIADKKNLIKPNWLNFVISEKAKSKIKKTLGLKNQTKKTKPFVEKNTKKIKLADCCKPLPGEDVIGVKTTKRKIIIHKKDCKNVLNLPKEKLVEIFFEKDKGTTKIKIFAMDRLGLLAEILSIIKKNGAQLKGTNFKIQNNNRVEATFDLEVRNIKYLNKIIDELNELPAIHLVERI